MIAIVLVSEGTGIVVAAGNDITWFKVDDIRAITYSIFLARVTHKFRRPC